MQTTKRQSVKIPKPRVDGVHSKNGPIARGPLVDVHHRAGATLEMVNGWEVAVRYPDEPVAGNSIIDLSHWGTYEVGGTDVGATLRALVGEDVPVRRIVVSDGLSVYRLTTRRGILFDTSAVGKSDSIQTPPSPLLRAGAIDVTGGWASFVLCGPDRLKILNKITALDLREETLPVGACCQGPIFGVNTLFGRFEQEFHLHVCPDSAEFFWEVLLDAGEEFGLKPLGIEQIKMKIES